MDLAINRYKSTLYYLFVLIMCIDSELMSKDREIAGQLRRQSLKGMSQSTISHDSRVLRFSIEEANGKPPKFEW